MARHANIWHTFAEGDDFARKARVLDAACVAVGRDPVEVERSVLVGGDPLDSGVALRAPGVSLFVLGANGPAYDLATVRRWVRWRDEQHAGA